MTFHPLNLKYMNLNNLFDMKNYNRTLFFFFSETDKLNSPVAFQRRILKDDLKHNF